MRRFEFHPDAIGALAPGDRARAAALVQEYRDRAQENPLELMVPYSKQQEFLASPARIRMFAGGNRAGKTTSGVTDDLIEVTPAELLPEHLRRFKRPEWECPRYVRCVCPSTKLIDSVFVEQFRLWTPRELCKRGIFDESYEKYAHVLRLECGCRLDFMSYEMELDKFGGSPFHRMHYDEEPPARIRQECWARLTDFNGVEIYTMTPLLGMTWMYDGIYRRAGRDPNVDVVTAALTDNPYLDPDGVVAALREYAAEGKEIYEARVLGRFVHFAGMVYPRFREWIGDAPSAEYVRSCEVVIGIDPGVAGFGLCAVAFDARGAAIVFDSAKIEGGNVADAARRIRVMEDSWGLRRRDVNFVIDPSYRSRTAISSATVETEFQAHDIFCEWGQTQREDGVMMIRRRGATGQLAVSRECRDWIWEAERYRIKERDDGKFDVVKEDDHVMDAFRYAMMSRPWAEEPEIMRKPLGRDVAQPPPRPQPKVSVMGYGA